MAKIEVSRGADTQFYWHMRNGGRITTDGEGHPTKANAIRAAKAVVRAIVKPLTSPYPVHFDVTEAPRKPGVTVITWWS